MMKIQQTEVHRTGLKVFSPEVLVNHIHLFQFLKRHDCGNWSHLIFLHIIEYNNVIIMLQ